MMRPLGPKELEMWKKYPATKYINEPREYFVAGPQAVIDATEEMREKARAFIRSDEGRRLSELTEAACAKFDEAKRALQEACEHYCEAEKARIDGLWKDFREKRLEKGPQVAPPTQKFHDRNWVDKDYGWEERVAESLTEEEAREARND